MLLHILRSQSVNAETFKMGYFAFMAFSDPSKQAPIQQSNNPLNL
jgi:hypothetical protein